jgi:hypothetical protein
VPAEGLFLTQRNGEMLLGIQHHFHNAVDIAISGNRALIVDIQPTRD